MIEKDLYKIKWFDQNIIGVDEIDLFDDLVDMKIEIRHYKSILQNYKRLKLNDIIGFDDEGVYIYNFDTHKLKRT